LDPPIGNGALERCPVARLGLRINSNREVCMADLAQSLQMLPPAFGVLGLLAAFVIYGMVKR